MKGRVILISMCVLLLVGCTVVVIDSVKDNDCRTVTVLGKTECPPEKNKEVKDGNTITTN